MRNIRPRPGFLLLLTLFASTALRAEYVNFESAHVHPIALDPSGTRLLAVNTPDAVIEIFAVSGDGTPSHLLAVPVGLEPVSVRIRTNLDDGIDEAWVVNQLSDTVSVVDVDAGRVVRTLDTGDEPTDVAFSATRAFVTVAGEDGVDVFSLSDPDAPPVRIDLFGRKPRAVAVDGNRVYVVPLHSGNRTAVVAAGILLANTANLDPGRLQDLGLNDMVCDGPPPLYPPLPPGITRDPTLPPLPGGIAPVGLIVKWDPVDGRFEDETGQDWSHCLPFTMPDHDLFVIDTQDLSVSTVDHLGTSLFDVSVDPSTHRIYVPHTEARNFVRFEHPLGVQGHVVDNRMAVVDPNDGFSAAILDLNTHIDRSSDPVSNLAERSASISQPGMMAWHPTEGVAWLTGIGTRKVFRFTPGCEGTDCFFGPDRASPVTVEVGEGPTGVVWHTGVDRLFVLNRFSNSIAIVDTVSRTKLGEIALHDPTPSATRVGRRFLYDAILGSGHGDNACSSCHLFGDRDDLAWDLGNPQGEFASYAEQNDNVRFVLPEGNEPVECDPAECASKTGFDPQKGPMTTQTLRGMLEPLHWRGDRATMNNFNQAFPGLMGTADIGPIDGEPAGLSAEEMEAFRQFALAIRFPPNPHRNVDDTLPDADLLLRGSAVPGNPTEGEFVFNSAATDAGQACVSCHSHPFGAAGGTLGGVTPTEPTSAQTAALFNGVADQSPHSDLKVAHLRNMYEKMGPVFGDHVTADPPSKSGVGFAHDGAIPDLATFFSFNVFTMTASQVADVAAFTLHFPTGTKPAVGRNLTLPAGTPPTGTSDDEALLATLAGLGDLAQSQRHCELTATTTMDGRLRSFHLSGGVWITDVEGETPLTTTALRERASSPVSFLCATIGSGRRLGGDRDEDQVGNGDDCAPADAGTWDVPVEVASVALDGSGETVLAWEPQASASGPSLRYQVLGGDLDAVRDAGSQGPTACVATGLADPSFVDTRPDPTPGSGSYYLVRAVNPCGLGGSGAGREALDTLVCD